tara:strand:+ start:894 stop:1619 length:726 start_codon:yes stop_codon:yes gene_type:complete
MAQHDYNIANQTASSARTDINNALSAIVSTNSGTTAPTSTFANMIWYDTSNNVLQIRNEGNTAWITLGTVDQGNSKFEPNQTIATQAEAEAGTNSTKMMTALRVLQSLTANLPIASEAEAIAGTNNTKVMTPLRTANSVNSFAIGGGQTWQSVSRSLNVTYTNSNSKPIQVNCQFISTNLNSTRRCALIVAGNSVWGTIFINEDSRSQFFTGIIVPAGATYVFSTDGTSTNSYTVEVYELR